MKYFFLLPVVVLFAACGGKGAKEKTETEQQDSIRASHVVIGNGKVLPENDIVQLSSPVDGIVQRIAKAENDTVSVGRIILELDHAIDDANIELLRNERRTQEAQVKVDLASLTDYKAKVNTASAELRRFQNLLSKGAETQQTVDNATSNLESLNANLAQVEATVWVSKSKWKETTAKVERALLERDQKIIRSPINGRILELSVLVGGSVSMQQSFVQISPGGKTIAICEIDEANADKIHEGQKGWIRSVGASDTLSTGTIYFVSAFLKKKSLFTDQSGEMEDRRVRSIKMFIDHPERLLLNARIECVIDISTNVNQ